MAMIHNRMPVILPVGARDRWLDPAADEAELRGLLVPLPPEHLEAYEVSTLVNSPRNDSPECVRPIVAGVQQAVTQRLLLDPHSRAERGDL